MDNKINGTQLGAKRTGWACQPPQAPPNTFGELPRPHTHLNMLGLGLHPTPEKNLGKSGWGVWKGLGWYFDFKFCWKNEASFWLIRGPTLFDSFAWFPDLADVTMGPQTNHFNFGDTRILSIIKNTPTQFLKTLFYEKWTSEKLTIVEKTGAEQSQSPPNEFFEILNMGSRSIKTWIGNSVIFN